MARFKVGQQIVMTVNGKWIFTNTKLSFWRRLFTNLKHGYGPRFNEVVTVDGYAEQLPGYILLREYRLKDNSGEYAFNESCFQPLMDINELTEILEQQPTEI